MNVTEAVKKRFDELCYQKGLNYCKLASMAGVPYTTVKSIFYNQSKNPGITTIKKLCDGIRKYNYINPADFDNFNVKIF